MAYTARNPNPVGRPRLLRDPQVRDNLIAALELGVPIVTACEAVSISKSTFFEWMSRGHDAFEDREAGEEPDPDEDMYHDLYCAVQEAKAKAAVRNVGVIQKAGQGGAITEQTTRKYRDPESGQLVTEETVRRSPPDWRAAAWYLERVNRDVFGKGAEQVEVTGAGGGPLQIASAEDLSARLAAHIAAGVAVPAALEARVDDDELIVEADEVEPVAEPVE